MDQETHRVNPRLPLTGLRVVALEQAVAAPLCTRHLADLGADVVKIERPGEGDFARGYDRAVKGLSSYFVWLNRGKANADRLANRVELEALVEATFGKLTRDEVERRLEEAEIANGRLNDVAALVDHPQLAARQRWKELESPVGRLRYLAHPFNLDGLLEQPMAVPDVGEQTDSVLGELGYSTAEIGQLRAAGTV